MRQRAAARRPMQPRGSWQGSYCLVPDSEWGGMMAVDVDSGEILLEGAVGETAAIASMQAANIGNQLVAIPAWLTVDNQSTT